MVAVARDEKDARRLAEGSPFYSGTSLIGTPEQVREQLRGWVRLGVTHFQLRFADFPRADGLQLFMEEVLPHFR